MKLCRYWAREKVSVTVPGRRRTLEIEVCGGSDTSQLDAEARARQRAARVREAIEAGRPPLRYAYSDRPLREEVLEEVRDGRELLAVVTRNSYGSRVLNAVHAMFIDIDMMGGRNPQSGRLPAAHDWFAEAGDGGRSGAWARIRRLLGAGRRERREAAFRAALSRIEETTRQVPRLGLRVYRTCAGYRCLVTSRSFDPASSESRALLERFRSDPMYIKLCEVQECYRARLSPKFWRCGADRPPVRFPFRSEQEEERYRSWERLYEETAGVFSTCRLVGSYGSEIVIPAIRPIVELHDRAACVESERLA